MPPDLAAKLKDPLKLARFLWPGVTFYRQQRDIIESVRDNDETIAVAGHQLGKDFVTAFICLWFFLTRWPVRIVTTSVKDDHLRVLWGEIGRFIDTARYPLTAKQGGPLLVNHRDVRKTFEGTECKISYLRGMVSEAGEGMAGHHAAHTLFVVDEASGVADLAYDRASTWAKRILVIGNPYECQNFFRKAVKGGNVPSADGTRLYRSVHRIRAEDSPNVQLGLGQQRAGLVPTDEILIPGVLSWTEYQKRRATWDSVRACVGLDAEFYEGAEVLLFPPAWLNRAESLADGLRGRRREAKAIGIDPAEGGDSTAMCAVDELGIVELVARKTPDTSVITGEALAFMRKHNVSPDRVVFDRGGGGKEHADRLRDQGYRVRTVAFGESVTLDPKRGMTRIEDRMDVKEERSAYKNRRAEMYGALHELLDPVGPGFAIPAEYATLRSELAPIPLRYDGEGRMELLPKNRRDPKDTRPTLCELIGHSPDQADSLVLAIHAMTHKATRATAGAF